VGLSQLPRPLGRGLGVLDEFVNNDVRETKVIEKFNFLPRSPLLEQSEGGGAFTKEFTDVTKDTLMKNISGLNQLNSILEKKLISLQNKKNNSLKRFF